MMFAFVLFGQCVKNTCRLLSLHKRTEVIARRCIGGFPAFGETGHWACCERREMVAHENWGSLIGTASKGLFCRRRLATDMKPISGRPAGWFKSSNRHSRCCSRNRRCCDGCTRPAWRTKSPNASILNCPRRSGKNGCEPRFPGFGGPWRNTTPSSIFRTKRTFPWRRCWQRHGPLAVIRRSKGWRENGVAFRPCPLSHLAAGWFFASMTSALHRMRWLTSCRRCWGIIAAATWLSSWIKHPRTHPRRLTLSSQARVAFMSFTYPNIRPTGTPTRRYGITWNIKS